MLDGKVDCHIPMCVRLGRLMQYCEEKRPDISELSDEELQQSQRESTKELIRLERQLAVTAASEMGWKVTL